jgi:hypothetical protein
MVISALWIDQIFWPERNLEQVIAYLEVFRKWIDPSDLLEAIDSVVLGLIYIKLIFFIEFSLDLLRTSIDVVFWLFCFEFIFEAIDLKRKHI